MPTITSNAFSSLQKKLKAANIEYSKAVMEIASGLSAKDLLSQIGLSKKEVEAIFINGRITPFDTVIKDGNRVAVVPNFTAEPYRNLQGLKNIWRIENTRIISGEKKQMITLNSELTIKNMSFKNRLVLPPITTNYGTSKGLVTQDILHFYKERSKDMGLVIVEATSVQSNGRIVPCSLGLWDDSQIPGMIKLAKTIQKQGAIAVVQLNHAGPRCIPLKSKRHG
ncbi:MAG: MoaD/ThiS family protein, partial [Proteobacteria bacterium]|nr:MoaD/ThiS family protein [Pseudomonadota bacterium]